MPFKYPSLCDRIIANSVLSENNFFNGSPCWEWIGARSRNRCGKHYGKLTIRLKRGPKKGRLKTWKVHRLVLIVFKGRRLTSRMVARHLCNNTLCCNPNHIVGGTQQSNVRQCVREERHYTPYRKAA